MKHKNNFLRPLAPLGLILSLGLSVPGCATTSAEATGATYSDQVEAAYGRAEQSLARKDYIEAVRRYNTVRNQFPYSQYAALAELRIGDAYYAQEQYATAIEQYRSFVQLHPNHDQVVYAYYRIALGFYEQMPGDWWLIPPSYEKDLTRARDAARELRQFLRHFPESEYAADANRKLGEVRRRMADHEFYVASFYLKRDNARAAAGRLTYLLTHYSGVGLDPQALFLLGRAYLELGEVDKAITALEDLVEVHPNSDLADEARKFLERHRS
ncbi:MAG: outer membrane protein assembly factor BamD [Bradymonadaceae bacterium]|nr:outer membrane protein assembly factor BamD [Lujinxingiaceae bacterium]